MKSPVILLRDLLFDLSRLHPDVVDLQRDFRTLEKRTKYEGFSFLAKTLPELDDAILSGIEHAQFACPKNFKRVRGGAIPRLFSGMLCKIFCPVTGSLLDTADPEALLSLRQVLCLYKKAVVSDEDDQELEVRAFDDFVSTDSDIRRLDDSQMLDAIRRVSQCILPDLTVGLDAIAGKHGPGAVYEGLKGNQKWDALYEELMEGSSVVDFGFDMFVARFFDGNSTHTKNKLKASTAIFGEPSSRSIARLVSVPKTSVSRRTITVEPFANMFVQQGLMAHLREKLRKCAVMSQCLDINDQSKNNHLALVGSLTREWATIDLKSASDLLSVNLVETVFGRDQEFLDLMLDYRSQYVEIKNEPLRIKKFAGMGNALTFPVQSVVYAVVSMAAILIERGVRITYRNVKAASRCIRVFGDDIVVKTEYMTQVCGALVRVGLRVNSRKSFSNGSFRESCGTDYFKGVLVTPVRMKFHPRLISTDTRAVTNLIHVANESFNRCLYRFGESIRSCVEEQFGPLPLVRRDSQALGWHTRLNATTINKWCSRTHQFLFKGNVVTQVKSKDPLDGYAALLKFFLTPRIVQGQEASWFDPPMERPNGHLEYTSVRYRTKVSRRWVASA
jgi:hypothetical protein